MNDAERAYWGLVTELNRRATGALKSLLETRHLYQKMAIEDPRTLIAGAYSKISTTDETARIILSNLINSLGIGRGQFILSTTDPIVIATRGGGSQMIPLTLLIPNIKIFCPICDCREAFSPIWQTDDGQTIRNLEAQNPGIKIASQSFTLAFQCQICIKSITSFLVKHEGWSLSVHGRSPMEEVEIPPFIPKHEARYFRDAIIAYNAGKTLAGLFYLRTFIEKFGRRQTGLRGRETGDAILQSYSQLLPQNLCGSMPSLAKIYSDLSVPIHQGEDDVKVFEDAKADVESHFDIRRVHKIPDAVPPAGNEGGGILSTGE